MDNHIRPLWSSCPFCAIDFDIIGQLEDYEEDEKFIVEKLDLDLPLGVHKNDASGRKSKSEKRNEFFSELSIELTQKIFNVYKLDFEMFGYDKPILQSTEVYWSLLKSTLSPVKSYNFIIVLSGPSYFKNQKDFVE